MAKRYKYRTISVTELKAKNLRTLELMAKAFDQDNYNKAKKVLSNPQDYSQLSTVLLPQDESV